MGGNGVLPGKRDLTMNKTKMAWASAALALALLLPAAGVKAYSSENVSLPRDWQMSVTAAILANS